MSMLQRVWAGNAPPPLSVRLPRVVHSQNANLLNSGGMATTNVALHLPAKRHLNPNSKSGRLDVRRE
jgi:hypothetical protein